MACIRKRRGKWVVDYRDGAGIRRWVTCDTRREADIVLSQKVRDSSQSARPAANPNIAVSEYAQRWLVLVEASVKPRTLTSYSQITRLHLLPAFGAVPIRKLHRARIKAYLAELLKAGFSRNTVRLIHATFRSMLNAAIDDGVIFSNPADRLGRQLRLLTSRQARQEEIKAFNRDELATFLSTAWSVDARSAPLFFTLARTGLRLGEALALQWRDIDAAKRTLRVDRAWSEGRVETPKSGHGRTVDMSQQLVEVLARLETERKRETLRHGWREMPAWVFCSAEGTPFDPANVRRTFNRVLKRAGLPRHFHPHCLRHTFASLLLQQGESPAYVQRQLGHASIQLTVDTYGRWLPLGNKAAVDRLDDPIGSKVVATGTWDTEKAKAGAEIRTPDLLITNPKRRTNEVPALQGFFSLDQQLTPFSPSAVFSEIGRFSIAN